MSDSSESKQVLNDFSGSENSFKIKPIANWVELRERYYHGAVQFREKRDFEKAFHYFHHAIISDPKHLPSYEQLIHVLIELKKFDHTNYYLNKLNDVSPEQASIMRGHVYFAKCQYTNSEIQFQLSLNINPTSQKAIFLLGLRNLLLNRFDQSEVNFEKLLKLNRNHLEAKFCLATIKMFKKEYESSINEFSKIISLDQNFFLCNYHIALCHFMLSNHPKSLKYCEKTLKMRHLSKVYDLILHNYFEIRDQKGLKRINDRIGKLYANKKIREEVYINNCLIQSFELMLDDPINFDIALKKIQNCMAVIETSPNDNLNEHVERLNYYSSIMNILITYQNSEDLENKSELPLTPFRFHTETLETYKLSNFLYLISLNYLKNNQDSLCETYIDRAINLNKLNSNFYLIKNLLYLRKNDIASSIEMLKRTIGIIAEKCAKLRYFLAVAFVKINKKELASEQLNHIIGKEWNSDLKSLFLNQFIDNDLTHEIKHSDWFNYSKIFDSMPKLVKEKLLYQHNLHVMDVSKLNFLIKVDFHLYFDLKCVNYLLLKAIVKYENFEFDMALSILSKAERLEPYNIGVMTYLGLIYLRLDAAQAEYYIQYVFDIKRRIDTHKSYLDFYRNKLTKFILDNGQISDKLSNKTQCLVNVSYESFSKARELFIDMLDKDNDINEDENRETYFNIYSYLIENLHRNKLDNELIYLSNSASQKLTIDLHKFDATSLDSNFTNERSIISRGILYTGISYFNIKEYEKSKVLLERNFLTKHENLMANFYHSVLQIKQKIVNPQILLKKFEDIIDIMNTVKQDESLLDNPEFDEIEVVFFILVCHFRLKNFAECSKIIRSKYNQLKKIKPKLAYCEQEVIYINGMLNFLDKKYDETSSLFRYLNIDDSEIQNEINFYYAIATYKLNDSKQYDSIIDAFRALEKLPENFETNILNVYDFKIFKLKCLVFLIIKSWADSREEDLGLFMHKFADETRKLNIKNEKTFIYRIVVSCLVNQDYTSSYEIVKDAISRFEKFKSFYYYAGLISFRLKLFTDSMKHFDRFIDESKSSEALESDQMVSNAYYFMALMNQDSNNYKKSLEYFDAAKLNEQIENEPNKWRFLIHDIYNECDLLYFKALSYLNLDEYEKTIELLNIILEKIEKEPKKKAFYSDECKLILARTLIKSKEYKKALKILKKIINLRSEDKRNQVYYYTGVLYFNMEEYKNSLGQFEELPDDFGQDDCGNFNLLKLKCLFFLILKSYKSTQSLLKSKLSSYLHKFNEIVDNKNLDNIADMLSTKKFYSVLIDYKVSMNYERTFSESLEAIQSYPDSIIFIYFCALAKYKDYLNLKFSINDTERETFLNSSEAYFEKFITIAKTLPGDEQDLKIMNSYYYLSIICQVKNNFIKANDYVDLVQTFYKPNDIDDLTKSEIEKLEILIDLSEFNSLDLDLLKSIILFNLNQQEDALKLLHEMEKSLSESSDNIRISQKDKINISNGVYFYLGSIYKKKTECLDQALDYFQKVKRRYNYFAESRYLIGHIYYLLKKYDQAYTLFKGLECKDFKDFDYKDDLNYFTIRTLFYLARPEIEQKMINSKNSLNKLIEKIDLVLEDKHLQELELYYFEILVIKTWCLYFTEKFEQLYSLMEKNVLPSYPKYTDFLFLYAISSVMLYHKFKAEAYLETSYKYFLDFLLTKEKNESSSLMTDYFKKFDLEIILTSKYYLANILTTKNYCRYEDGIKLLIEVLYHDNLNELENAQEFKDIVNEGLKKSKLEKITRDFPFFREFDVYDLIYYLGVNLNEVEMYEKSYQMLIALVNDFKLRDEKKANEVNFYLGFARFKLEDYKNASDYFDKYKPTEDEYPKQVPKIELARYYIGICLYNKKDPDFLRAIKKFKEISQDYKNKEELSDLAHYLIDSNYKLAVGYLNTNTHGKWNEYFSFTLEVCNEFLQDYNFDYKNFNPIVIEALEKKSLALYHLSQFETLKEFLVQYCIEKFPQNIFFYYIQSLCFYKMIIKGCLGSDEQRVYCDEAIKSVQNFITISKSTGQEASNNKILNLRFIKSVIYLSYPESNDTKMFINSMDMLKGLREEFKISDLQDDDLIVFDTENLEFQEAVINFMSENYEKAMEKFQSILEKKYFKNDELKLSDVHYHLAMCKMKLDLEPNAIIQHLKYVKKESKFYEKSKFYLAVVLFEIGDLKQSFDFIQSYDQSYDEELEEKFVDYSIKIPYYLGNFYMSLGNRTDAVEKYALASDRSSLFLLNSNNLIKQSLSDGQIKAENFDTFSSFQKLFVKILTYKLWSLLHLKSYSEITKLIDEYELLGINDILFLKAFAVYKLNMMDQASKLFEQYLMDNTPDIVFEKSRLPFIVKREEKNLISIYCLAQINKPNSDREFLFLSNILSLLNSNCELEKLSLNEIMKQCRTSQNVYLLNEIDFADIMYKWLTAFYIINAKMGLYEAIHRKYVEIQEEFDLSANFFSQNQKDNLLYFLANSLFEHLKIENDQNIKENLKNEFLKLSENLKKLKLNTEYYSESLILLAEFYYHVESLEYLDKSIYYLEKLIGTRIKNDYKILKKADHLLLLCYSRKNLSNQIQDLLSPDYIKFNELFDRLRVGTTDNIKELAMLNKLKIDLKVIKFKNEKTLESTLNIATQAFALYPENLEILFYKAKIEYLIKPSADTLFNTYLAKCNTNSYPGAKYHLQEAKYLMVKFNMNRLDTDDLREKTGYSANINKLIKEIEKTLSFYKSDCIDLNFLYFDFAQIDFKEGGYKSCINRLKKIDTSSLSERSSEYNLSHFYFMLGVSQMNIDENNELALESLAKIGPDSQLYEKSLLCLIHINYYMENYEYIIKTYPSIILSYSRSQFIFDYQAYVISSRFWLTFNDFKLLNDQLKEIERNNFTRDDLHLFYISLIKLWIGSSKELSSLKSEIQPNKQSNYESIVKAAYVNTNELDFVNGLILYAQKKFSNASNLLRKFINSGSKNTKCIFLSKFYYCYSEYYMIIEKLSETRDSNQDFQVKLRAIIKSLKEEILNSEFFVNNRKDLTNLLGNVYFDLMIITKFKSDAEYCLSYFQEFYEQNVEYDDDAKLKIGICNYYLDKFLDCFEILEGIKQKDLIVKYFTSLCLKNVNSFSKSLDLMSEVIGNLNKTEPKVLRIISDIYYQRGLLYLNQSEPDYSKALSDFLEQIRVDKNHASAYQNLIDCIELVPDHNISEKELSKFYLKLFFASSEENRENWLNKLRDLVNKLIDNKEIELIRIYLSYNLGSKDTVFSLYELMLQLGLKCFINKENQSVSLNDSNASLEILKRSELFLNFITPEYVESSIGQEETLQAIKQNLNIYSIILKYPQGFAKESNEKQSDASILNHFGNLNVLSSYKRVKLFNLTKLNENDLIQEKIIKNQNVTNVIISIFDLILG